MGWVTTKGRSAMEDYIAGYEKGQRLAKVGAQLPKFSKLRSADFVRGCREGWLFYLMGV
jgi:hypothetical protein